MRQFNHENNQNQSRMSLSQMYHSEIHQSHNPKPLQDNNNNIPKQFKFNPYFSDRKMESVVNVLSDLDNSPCFTSFQKSVQGDHLNLPKFNMLKQSAQYHTNSQLKLSQQFQLLHFTEQEQQQDQTTLILSIYYSQRLIGVVHDYNDTAQIMCIEQSQIYKIRQLIMNQGITCITLLHQYNIPQNLLESIQTVLSGVCNVVKTSVHHDYNSTEQLIKLGYTDLAIIQQAEVDASTNAKLHATLPLLNKFNIDRILKQIDLIQNASKLNYNENCPIHLHIKKSETTQLCIQQCYEKYFTTSQAKKLLADRLSNPINSYSHLIKRLQSIQQVHQFFLQPSNQKFSKFAGKINSFSQILKILGNYPERSEPYSKLHQQLLNLQEFINQAKQIILVDRKTQQPSCELFKQLATSDLDSVMKLIDCIECSLIFNGQMIEIKRDRYPKLDKLLNIQTQLHQRMEYIGNKYKQDLLCAGIQCIPKLEYVQSLGYLVSVQQIIDSTIIRDTLQWELVRTDQQTKYYKTFYTTQLDEQFNNIQDDIVQLQQKLLVQIIKEIQQYQELLVQFETLVGEIDYNIGLAQAMTALKLCIPEINLTNAYNIVGGRHLLVEQSISLSMQYQANDFSTTNSRIYMIVGPNFSGKSVYIRQVGQIAYLAHCGLPVAAQSASIGLLDSIYTLFPCESQSTNMNIRDNELFELCRCIKQSSAKSMILLDEVGKNFKYQMGCNLQRSTLEYLYSMQPLSPIVLLATHYQSVQMLQDLPNIIVGEMEVVCQSQTNLIFIYKIKFRKNRIQTNSFGLEVAFNIHLNEQLYQRSTEILDILSKYKQLQ